VSRFLDTLARVIFVGFMAALLGLGVTIAVAGVVFAVRYPRDSIGGIAVVVSIPALVWAYARWRSSQDWR